MKYRMQLILLALMCYQAASAMEASHTQETDKQMVGTPGVTSMPMAPCAKVFPSNGGEPCNLYPSQNPVGIFNFEKGFDPENLTPSATSVGNDIYVTFDDDSTYPSCAAAQVNHGLQLWTTGLKKGPFLQTQIMPLDHSKETVSFFTKQKKLYVAYSRNGEKPATLYFDAETGKQTFSSDVFYQFISDDGVIGITVSKDKDDTAYASSFIIEGNETIQEKIKLPSANVSASPDARMLAALVRKLNTYTGINIITSEYGETRNTIEFSGPKDIENCWTQFSNKGAMLALVYGPKICLYRTSDAQPMFTLEEPNKFPITNLQVRDFALNNWIINAYAKDQLGQENNKAEIVTWSSYDDCEEDETTKDTPKPPVSDNGKCSIQ